jgi:hypothetical protein
MGLETLEEKHEFFHPMRSFRNDANELFLLGFGVVGLAAVRKFKP